MNKKWIFRVVALVALVHVGVFLALANFKPLPKKRRIPRPTFTAAEKAFVDETTGERMIAREYTISTKLNENRPK